MRDKVDEYYSRLNKLTAEAHAMANKIAIPDQGNHNGIRDAFRHAYVSARLSKF